jgi:choline-phosphate cytidylyltransferase
MKSNSGARGKTKRQKLSAAAAAAPNAGAAAVASSAAIPVLRLAPLVIGDSTAIDWTTVVQTKKKQSTNAAASEQKKQKKQKQKHQTTTKKNKYNSNQLSGDDNLIGSTATNGEFAASSARFTPNWTFDDVKKRRPWRGQYKTMADQIREICRNNPERREYRIFSDGCFDLAHFGHAKAFQQAKELFHRIGRPDVRVYLIVGVCSDRDTKRFKGQPVLSQRERAESVRHFRWVDEVILACPWIITRDFIAAHHIDFVAHDSEPYEDLSGQYDDCYGVVKELGCFIATQRTEGVSTSDIITRIVSHHDEFVRRSFNKGFSRSDLNVSLYRAGKVKAVDKLKAVGAWVSESPSTLASFLRWFDFRSSKA